MPLSLHAGLALRFRSLSLFVSLTLSNQKRDSQTFNTRKKNTHTHNKKTPPPFFPRKKTATSKTSTTKNHKNKNICVRLSACNNNNNDDNNINKISKLIVVLVLPHPLSSSFWHLTMSSGGPATTSSNTSPRVAAGPTTTRRRVPDISTIAVDAEKQQPASSFSDFSEVEQDDAVSGGNVPHHHHAHLLHHHLHPATRYLLLRARFLFCVPEPVFLRVEHVFIWLSGSVQSLRSGKNVGRKIFALLIAMVVMSVFVKVSFIGGGVEMNGKSIENGQLILQRFKEDWASAQRVVTETNTETSMPKRVLERLAVSDSSLSLSLALSHITFLAKVLFSPFLTFFFYFLSGLLLKIIFRESVFFS